MSKPCIPALTLLYGPTPPELSPDEAMFCIFSETAVQVAICAHAARTWGEFAQAVGVPFERLIDPETGWPEQIAAAFGRIPRPTDPFRLDDYWGNWHFADLVIPPCQAAVFDVQDRPAIDHLLTRLGFEFALGAPCSEGDAIIFRDRAMGRRLEDEIARCGLQDQVRIREAAPHALTRQMGLE
jgi:hypothetical protein